MQSPRPVPTPLAKALWIAAGALLTGAFIACATGDTADDGPVVTDTGGTGDGGVKDTGKEGGSEGGTSCTGAAAANTCAAPIDVGTVALGKTVTKDVTLAPANRDVWFKMTFTGLDQPAAHPHVKLTADAAAILQMEIAKGCAGEHVSCGAEDAGSAVVTEFESSYLPGAGDGGDETGDPIDDADIDAGTFTPIAFGTGGVLYVRVFRKLGAPGPCAPLTLTVSN
jgi:hypothetical protein